jgi:Ca-activated chloride channel homolog
MGRGLLLLASLVVASPLAGVDAYREYGFSQADRAQNREGPQVPSFRSGVELVTLTATVRDRRGRLVTGLGADDFEVLESGVARTITDFRTEPSPVSVAILFDVSGSMRIADRMLAARFAAHHVLSALEPGRDEAALFTFDSRLHEVAPFTVDTHALQGVLGEVDPFGATSLHDAIAGAARLTGMRSGRRRAVVAITDGVDTASGLTPGEVSGIASVIDVPVYVIATVLPIDHLSRRGALPRQAPVSRDGTIEDLARWTGGALLYTSTPADASDAARRILEELRVHYILAFEPAAGNGWRPLEVRTRGKDHVVRARGGYMAGNTPPLVEAGIDPALEESCVTRYSSSVHSR